MLTVSISLLGVYSILHHRLSTPTPQKCGIASCVGRCSTHHDEKHQCAVGRGWREASGRYGEWLRAAGKADEPGTLQRAQGGDVSREAVRVSSAQVTACTLGPARSGPVRIFVCLSSVGVFWVMVPAGRCFSLGMCMFRFVGALLCAFCFVATVYCGWCERMPVCIMCVLYGCVYVGLIFVL